MAELSNPIIKQAMAFDIYAWLAQRLPRIKDKVENGLALENRAKAQKAGFAQQQLQLADQLATRESAGRQEAGQSSQQDFQASVTTAAANWLVFEDPAPPAAKVVSIWWRSSDRMFGVVGGRPADGTFH
jgi:hypothetical protein